ncbi:CoA-binding protein [Vulcanibacillus modesticaldus]|uniref:CoA-binding protein n=1 Tax=Vulcanibacillus modesticaldus TaxID=337097 RepID=A0A1D2YS61_9BACI|nr:CoA-binding protein [Vulcanibacillus modesticaldus]OEF96900.1 CoA-binding protein [Vulcanibacillus modesticaldus]
MSLLKTDDQIKELIQESKRIAIVGLSNKSERDSYRVAKYLLDKGFEIIPVNPTVDEVLGIKAVGSLKEIEGQVDMVDVFRKPDQVMPIVEEAIAIGAKSIWFQLGVVNESAAKLASDNGLKVVMDRCVKIEHNRLF